MNRLRPLILLITLIGFPSIQAQSLLIGPPTIQQEASSIWRTINDIGFLEGQGYRIHLPEHPLIDSLIAKSKEKAFGNEDFPTIYQLLEEELYRDTPYQTALEKVLEQQPILEEMLARLDSISHTWNWEFRMFEEYPIVLTLYGTGGSYDPETGQVTLFTNEQGQFMKYRNAAYTIIHEIVHMGIEQSIIQTYGVTHGDKERIVDTIVWLLFQEYLPGYEIQEMGNEELSERLNSAKHLADLPQIVEQLTRNQEE